MWLISIITLMFHLFGHIFYFHQLILEFVLRIWYLVLCRYCFKFYGVFKVVFWYIIMIYLWNSSYLTKIWFILNSLKLQNFFHIKMFIMINFFNLKSIVLILFQILSILTKLLWCNFSIFLMDKSFKHFRFWIFWS